MKREEECLSGRRALVIGGSRGIGAAVVKRLAVEGARVAFTYASAEAQAQALVAEVEKAGGVAFSLRADSADPIALERAIDDAAQRLGGLDVLVNNAGVMVFGTVDTISLEAFDRIVAINVRGAFVAAKGAARHLQRGGKLLFIGSNTADVGMSAGSAIYGMTKAAVARLVRGLAHDFGPRGLAAINVQPGPTVTDLNPADGPHAGWIKERSPEGRIADADEIARFVAYLASPASTYVNGASLTIDGGFTA